MTPIRKLRRESLGFAIGSLCFALGALPGYLDLVGQRADNVTYAIGAVFFTGAAFIQLRLSGRGDAAPGDRAPTGTTGGRRRSSSSARSAST